MPPSNSEIAATVGPLLDMWGRVFETSLLGRMARAVELAERALEAARRVLPRDSLGVVCLSDSLTALRISGKDFAAGSVTAGEHCDVMESWERDARLLELSRGVLETCCARLEAGTLCTLTL